MRILSVTTVRNEGPYLLEWIAHHRAAGVTDFLIYSNDCEDGSDAMLDALQKARIITHRRHTRQEGKSIQWQALQDAWRHDLRKQADWVLASDVDEFVSIHAGDHTLPDLIAAMPDDADAMVLPWRLFGHSDVVMIEDEPVTEQFTRAAPPDLQFPVAASLFKTLFRTDGPFNQLGVHRPRQKNPEKHRLPRFVDGSGQPLPGAFASHAKRLSLYGISKGRALAEMNHYAIRSAAAFLVKRDRGLPNRSHRAVDLTYWVERNFNTVEDRSIAAMSGATQAQLRELHEIPGVVALHAKALEWHRARFEQLVRDPVHQKLLTQVLAAGSSAALPEDLQRRLVQWYQEAHD